MTFDRYPATFRVVPLSDHTEGVPAHGSYAECYWLPILHPSAYVLGRRLVNHALDSTEVVYVDARWLAASLGILGKLVIDGEERTSLSGYGRAVRKLVKYHLLVFDGNTARVRTVWPRVNQGLLNDLPADVREYEPTMWEAEPRTALSVPAWGR